MTKDMSPDERDTARGVRCREQELRGPPPTGWSRRTVITALLLLPLSGGLGGCAGARPSETRAALRATRDDLRVFLKERAADPAESERLLALADAIEDRAVALLEEVARFDADFYAALENPEITGPSIDARIDAHLERRAIFRRSLLDGQERLKRAVGKKRWDDLVDILNSGAEELVRKTRAA